MVNQHTITGMALKQPMTTRKSAAYWSFGRRCTVRRMAKPVMDTQMGIRVKRKRCLRRSERVATSIAKTKAQAQGGTEWSWVPIGVYPNCWMMVGAKYA